MQKLNFTYKLILTKSIPDKRGRLITGDEDPTVWVYPLINPEFFSHILYKQGFKYVNWYLLSL